MVGAFVTSAGLMLGNGELLQIRSRDPSDLAYLIQGTSFESLDQYPEQWLYIATSESLKWQVTDLLGCGISRLHVSPTADVRYDLVVWSEAENRQIPFRDMVPITRGLILHVLHRQSIHRLTIRGPIRLTAEAVREDRTDVPDNH